ncbi:hypothetical protein Belba_3656 [Belliella baltica DSM 15883]|uniref:HTH cro/C1-type domain-containing protein n=2 Tax=Belliella TaxID=232244 RepID=I3ZA79_BELBD|nr:hypothetical protein Belba_3656 [Belliella baltica DSM 15883]
MVDQQNFTKLCIVLKSDQFLKKPMQKNIHQGRNVKRFREMLGIKQEVLAYELGEDWSQKKISLLEQREIIEEDILKQVSEILRIPVEAIQNFDEEQAITVISSTFNDNSAVVNNNPTFHPIDKLIQLHEEKIALYERMLKEKDEMMAKLERLIK